MVQTKTRRLTHSIYGVDLGLTLNKPPTQIDERATPKCRNVLFKYGYVSPAPGYTTLGSNLPLLGSFMEARYWTKQDGVSNALVVHTTSDVYKYNTTTDEFDLLTENTVVEDCEDVWVASANVTCAVDGADYKIGTYSVKLTIADAFTTGLIAYEDFSSADLTDYDTIRFWFKSSVTLAAGAVQILLDDTSGCVSPKETLDLPAITADTWTYVSIALDDPTQLSAIISVGLNAVTDPGDGTIFRIDDVKVFDTFSGDTDDMYSIVVYQDSYVFTQGIENVKVWDMAASAVSTLTGTTNYKCKALAVLGERICMYNLEDTGVDKPQRVRWCVAGDVTDWSGGGSGYNDLTTSMETGGIINALPLGNYVVLYGKRTITLQEYVGGSTIYNFDKRVTDKGPINGRCVVDVGTEHAFVGTDDVYAYSGGRYVDPIGANILPDIIDTIETDKHDRCFAEYIPTRHELQLHIVPTGETLPTLSYILDIRHKNWAQATSEFTGYGSYVVTSATTIGDLVGTIGEQNWKFGDSVYSANKRIHLYGTSDGYVRKLDISTYNNAGSAIDEYIDTKDFVIGERYKARIGEWFELNFEAKGNNVSIYYSTDAGDTYILLETVTLTNDWARYNIDFDINAQQVRFRFRNNTVSEAFFLRWIELGYMEGSEVF